MSPMRKWCSTISTNTMFVHSPGKDRRLVANCLGLNPMSLDPKHLPMQRRVRLYTKLGCDRLQITELKGRERLSRPYGFRMKLRSDSLDAINLDDLIGTAVRVSIQLPEPHWATMIESDSPWPTRDFCGILSRISHVRSNDRYRFYQAVLRPRLWTLGLNKQFRAFSQLSTRDIVSQVLDDLPARWCIGGDRTHNYCVQYGESDLNFISRLLEEDGLFYFFEHQYDSQPEDESRHTERLVIADDVNNLSQEFVPVHSIDEVGGGVRDSMRIRQWSTVRRMTPEKIVSLDRHFQRPSTLVVGDTLADIPEGSTGNVTIYPSGLSRRSDNTSPSGSDRDQLSEIDAKAKQDATIRAQRLRCESSECRGAGDVASMMPGTRFGVTRNSISDTVNYYLTEVEHLVRLSANSHSGDQEHELRYYNRFRCNPEMFTFRPSRITPKPRVEGVVPATVVVDPSITDDEVCVDKYGRVKVEFPWQQRQGQPSCWVRVSQFWAGPRWGAYFWPRKGHEVLVAFEHGDPDRPVIVGSMYNANNMPPLTLPAHKLSCGIHSCSHKGNPIENTSCVVFHDKKGDEYLQVHSETFQCMTSETKELKIAAGESIVFQGHSKILDLAPSSGRGGSDCTGENDSSKTKFKTHNVGQLLESFAKSVFAIDTDGEISFSFGDGYAKKFGRHFESNFGCKLWIGCDPIELIENAISNPILGALIPLVFGAGGQGKTLVGNTQNINYGDKYDVLRGASYKNAMPSWRDASMSGGNVHPWEKLAAKVCFLMAALCLFMDMLFLLLTRMFVEFETKKWSGATEFCNVWSLAILPRLQGVLEYIECLLAKIKTLHHSVEEALDKSKKAVKKAVRAAVSTDSAQEDDVSNLRRLIEECLDWIRETLAMAKALVTA